MGFLGDVLGLVIDVVEVPIAVVKDVVTLGGACTMKDETYTGEALKKLDDDARSL